MHRPSGFCQLYSCIGYNWQLINSKMFIKNIDANFIMYYKRWFMEIEHWNLFVEIYSDIINL